MTYLDLSRSSSWFVKRSPSAYFATPHRKQTAWLYETDNRPVAEALLVANVPGMTPGLAAATYDRLLDRESGFYRRVTPNIAGIGTVLALRGKYGMPRKKLGDPMKYIDLGYYDAAVGD